MPTCIIKVNGFDWTLAPGPLCFSAPQFSGSIPGGHGSASFTVPVNSAYLAPHHSLREGAWTEWYDENAVELYEGEVFSIKPQVDSSGNHSLAVTCGGLISVAGKRADVSATWVHRGSEGWIRRPGTPSNLGNVTLDAGVIDLRVSLGSTQDFSASGLNNVVGAMFVLDSGLSDDTISHIDFAGLYDVTAESALNWTWGIWTRADMNFLSPSPGWTLSALTSTGDSSAGFSDHLTPPANTRVVLLQLYCAGGAHTTAAEKYITLTTADIFAGGRTTKPRIDEAMVALATRPGLALTSYSESVGAMLDDLRVGNGIAKVTAAEGMTTVAGLYPPFEWGFWDARKFICKPQTRVPANDAKVIVVGGGFPGLDSWDVAEDDEDVPQYACVFFANKDDPNLPEGWPRRIDRPGVIPDTADLRVAIVDYSNLILNDSAATAAGDNLISSGASGTGGVVTTDGLYTVHKFNATGYLYLPDGVSLSAETPVVAGGGGGGYAGGGGGGAGGYKTTTQTVSGLMPVTVGAGGKGATDGAAATSGGDSTFGTLTATGGGAGGNGDVAGVAGGSGGGGGGSLTFTPAGGAASPAGQGNAGGTNGGHKGTPGPGGGGGGAGAAGANATSDSAAGVGGAGISNDIVERGVNVGYAGGGGGGLVADGAPGTASHGGGAGGDSAAAATAGTRNTGGGGGGGSTAASGYVGKDGGSGVVVVRYLTPEGLPPRSLAKGTVVITGTVRNRKGAPVPEHHVRAGWWIQNLDWQPDPKLPPPALYITGHSVDLAGKKNALTIGVDWMEKEIGVRMAELLAIPPTVVPDALTQDAVDPYTPDTGADAGTDAGTEPDYGKPADPFSKTPTNPDKGEIGDPTWLPKLPDPNAPRWDETLPTPGYRPPWP